MSVIDSEKSNGKSKINKITDQSSIVERRGKEIEAEEHAAGNGSEAFVGDEGRHRGQGRRAVVCDTDKNFFGNRGGIIRLLGHRIEFSIVG